MSNRASRVESESALTCTIGPGGPVPLLVSIELSSVLSAIFQSPFVSATVCKLFFLPLYEVVYIYFVKARKEVTPMLVRDFVTLLQHNT